MGGAQVLLKNLDAALDPAQRPLWPLLLEICVSVLWSYPMLLLTAVWLARARAAGRDRAGDRLAADPAGRRVVLGATCLLQFAFSSWLDGRYDRGLGRNLFWMIWYPLVFWLINCAATVVAYPEGARARPGPRARGGSAPTAESVRE